MANKHLLPCACGRSVPVEPSQAGGQVTCDCGAKLDVPTLTALRALPRATEESPRPADTSQWSAGHGVLTGGLLLAAVLAGLGGWWWVSEPPMPETFDADAAQQIAAEAIEQMTPTQGYDRWVNVYLPKETLRAAPDPLADAARENIARQRLVRWMLLGGAALVAVVSVLGFLALKPAPR